MLSAMYSNCKRDDEEGFTLIELLIVVIIIGILAAIALPIFIDQQKVAIDASVQSDVRNSVTNITNAQAQESATVKAAVSNANTKVTLSVPSNTTAPASTATKDASDLTNVPGLGTSYFVDGYNAGGKKYQGTSDNPAFEFSSDTGRFTQANGAAADGGTGNGGGTGTGTGGGSTTTDPDAKSDPIVRPTTNLMPDASPNDTGLYADSVDAHEYYLIDNSGDGVRKSTADLPALRSDDTALLQSAVDWYKSWQAANPTLQPDATTYDWYNQLDSDSPAAKSAILPSGHSGRVKLGYDNYDGSGNTYVLKISDYTLQDEVNLYFQVDQPATQFFGAVKASGDKALTAQSNDTSAPSSAQVAPAAWYSSTADSTSTGFIFEWNGGDGNSWASFK